MDRAYLAGLLLLLTSCDPRFFVTGVDRPVDGKILSPLHTVALERGTITLNDSGAVQLKVVGLTQFDFSMWAYLRTGTGFRMLLRPVVEESIIDSGLVLSVTTDGVSLTRGDSSLATRPGTMPRDTNIQIRYYSENEFIRVMVGCDTVVHDLYGLKESDDIVLAAMPGSTVDFRIPNWEPTYLLKIKDNYDPLFSRSESDDPWRLGRGK